MGQHMDDWTLFRLQRLKPERFEELCFALLRAKGHTKVRDLGLAGTDGGVDLLSIDPDGRRCITQCKRCRLLGPAAAVRELDKVLKQPPDPPASVWRLVATCPVSSTAETKLQQRLQREADPLAIEETWAQTALVAFLRDDHPDLHEKFIHKPGPLPYWNVPNRTSYFVGRDDVLEQLHAALNAGGAAAITQTITGLGGVGKTQVAIAYCRRHRSAYDMGVFWINGQTSEAFRADAARIAKALDIAPAGTPAEEATDIFLRRLVATSDWLLVVDNADEPDEVRALIPQAAGGHVVVTTRRQRPDLGKAKPIAVDLFEPLVATEFLLERGERGEPEREEAARLAKALGYLPLALEQAGAYLNRHPSVSIGEYLQSFEKHRLDRLEAQSPAAGDYESTVGATWEISIEKIAASSPAAVEALHACAFVAPGGIPLALFTETKGRLGPAIGELIAASADDPPLIGEQIIEPMARYSLVQFDDERELFSVHRLVQEVVRQRLRSDGELERVHDRTHAAIAACFPRDPEDPADWERGALWLPHVQAGLPIWGERAPQESSAHAALWGWAAHYAWAAGRASEARQLFEQALEAYRRVLGAEHPDTLISMNNLAATRRALGDAEGARQLHEDALEVRRRVLGPSTPTR